MHVTGNSPLPVRSPAATVLQPRPLLLATDLQQSILAELDRSGPNLRAYTPYGSPSSLRPTSAGLGFTGQLKERSTGWYHLGNGHRVYNPMLMRFHSPDRLSPFDKGGLNAYAYCKGDPLNYTDPTGKVVQVMQWAGSVALHSASSVFTFLGPKPGTPFAVKAAQFGLVGSAVTLTGVGLGVAGVAVAGHVTAVGTWITATAAASRAAGAVVGVLKNGGVKQTIATNARAVFGFSGSSKVVNNPAPPAPLSQVVVEPRTHPIIQAPMLELNAITLRQS